MVLLQYAITAHQDNANSATPVHNLGFGIGYDNYVADSDDNHYKEMRIVHSYID
jgi:hypothetical protein